MFNKTVPKSRNIGGVIELWTGGSTTVYKIPEKDRKRRKDCRRGVKAWLKT